MYFGDKTLKYKRFNEFKKQILAKGANMELKELQEKFTRNCIEIGRVEYNIKVLMAQKEQLLELSRQLNEAAGKLENPPKEESISPKKEVEDVKG